MAHNGSATVTKTPLAGVSRYRRTRRDRYRAAVKEFLMERNYKDTFENSEYKNELKAEDFILRRMVEADSFGPNIFTYSNVVCISSNHHMISQQFGNFCEFVEAQPSSVRNELRRLYAPLMGHLYLDLLKAYEANAALGFLKDFAHVIGPHEIFAVAESDASAADDEAAAQLNSSTTTRDVGIRFIREESTNHEQDFYMRLLEMIWSYTDLDAVYNHVDVATFRSAKTEIDTTQEAYDALRTYFARHAHVLIVNIFHVWLHIGVIETDRNYTAFPDSEEETEIIDDKHRVVRRKFATSLAVEEDLMKAFLSKQLLTQDEQYTEERFKEQGLPCLLTLYESKAEIVKSQKEFPRFVKIADRTRGLISAHIDSDECHLVAGFNTSVVKLWQLDHQTCLTKNFYGSFADKLCAWEVNNCLEEDADEVEVEIGEHLKKADNWQRRKYYEAKYEDNSYNEYGGIELRGHGLGVTDVRFSANYNLIFSASKDSTMRCWRAESYACASVYRGHRYPIWCLAESPTGMYVATGSMDMTARLWSLEREFPMTTYVGHSQDVECIDFHPNGSYLATGSADRTVRMYCVVGGKVTRIFAEGTQPIASVAFSPNGRLIAAAEIDTTVRLFDLAAGAQLQELKTLSSSVSSIAWSSCSKYLTAVSTDGSFRMWNVNQLSDKSSDCDDSNDSSLADGRVMALSSNCDRLVKVMYGSNDVIYCIGA